MSNFNNSAFKQKNTNKLELNSTLAGGDDEISMNGAMMDEIDQALYKCIDEQ